jgi:NADH-quinone oxidoreductase subunit L
MTSATLAAAAEHPWFLENAWLIPLIPALSFVAILAVGKRLGARAAWIGVGSVGGVWVLAVGSAIQWIQRINSVHGGEESLPEASHAEAFRTFGRGVLRPLAEEAEHATTAVTPITRSVSWWSNGGFDLNVGIRIDGLAVVLLVVVTTISLLVHYYSTEYMKDDRRFTHYFAALSLFTASMLFLVVADNMVQFLVGWELVGLCSFLLIGHWWEEKPNSDAALKAFLTTRTGDIGLLCGVIMTYFVAQRATGQGTFDIGVINQSAMSLGADGTAKSLLFWCAAGLLLGIMGKSGQFPLHTWLPDAMAGPTPVSALIHAATMVVAGVYLGARVYPVFFNGFDIAGGGVNLMAAIGGITVIIGAALAFVQRDIKKVLAYSTISQLGYMVMGLGVGAWSAALFHLFTHAFFKANLFLGAGSVSHSGAHHSFDMVSDMGGLRKYMPRTYATFLIGTAALAGFPLFAGFFSKDEILATAGHNGYEFFMYLGFVGGGMTAAYMTRCIYLTFHGEYRGARHPAQEHTHGAAAAHADADAGRQGGHANGHEGGHADHGPHESPRPILVPLYVLSFMSVAAGLVFAPMLFDLTDLSLFEKFPEWTEPGGTGFVDFAALGLHPEFRWIDPLLATLFAGIGFGLSYAFFWKKAFLQEATLRNKQLRAGKKFLENKYYLDHLYTDIVVGTTKGPIARAAYWVNQYVIDAVLRGAGVVAKRAGRFTYDVIDQKGVDGVPNGLAALTGTTGGATNRLQTGRLQGYALWILLGTTALAFWVAAIVLAN